MVDNEAVASGATNWPDFLVLGAAKCGTTSLRNYLAQHPQLFLPERGEPSFFAHHGTSPDFRGPGDDEWTFVTDISDYQALFSKAAAHQLTGEISPRYLYFEQAPELISRLAPEAKLIAILRHPVDRAYSHFMMNRSRACEPESSFDAALRLSDQRWKQGWGWDWMYVESGRYAEQLQRFLDHFPSEQLGVYVYEEWVADTDQFYGHVFDFLGVDADFLPETGQRERTATMPRSAALAALFRNGHGLTSALRKVTPPAVRRMARQAVESVNVTNPDQLDPQLRADLFDEFFRADVVEVERLIGRPIPSWSPARVR